MMQMIMLEILKVLNRWSRMNNKITSVEDCKLISLPKIHNIAGNITVLENDKNIPFEVKRVYYLYDVPSNEGRGGHAHYQLKQYLVAATGSFDVVLNDGVNTKTMTLNKPNMALYIVPGLWRELQNFSGSAICLVLASNVYQEEDYIREFKSYKEWKLSK